MKKIIAILSVILCLCLTCGCVGTPVIYHNDCDCSEVSSGSDTNTSLADGELLTGIAITTGINESVSAEKDKEGEGKYDVTMVAVLIDGEGIIYDCVIDGVSASVKFDNAGQITTKLTDAPQTKNELGENYGMVAYGGAKYEWNEQAAALAKFAVGKTVKQLRDGAVDKTGKAPEGSDLASSATIYLGGYVSAIESAALNAKALGAKKGDNLYLTAQSAIKDSKSATESDAGNAQLDVTAAATTVKDDVVTSCFIDSVQAKIAFDNKGVITTDLSAPIKTKNELGKDYGMVAYAGAKYEWNEQAASFAKYITGKTLAEVEGISVDERTAPTDVDLASTVTIAIGDFKALIAKISK